MTVGITIIVYFVMICISEASMQRFYRAAVVEYAPKREPYYLPRQILMGNTNRYLELIDEISSKVKPHIIIFPEYGSTTLEVLQKVPAHLESYSITIPEITQDYRPNPCCNNSEKYHKALIDLSCAARTANVHVVVHFLEREGADRSNFIFYSTNVVFNNNGNIIHKYRKMNLHTEKHLKSGTTQTNYFDTSFGVTFGLLMGADILYKYPSSNFLDNPNITDIIYTTAWHSEIPFLHGLSIQQGLAKANRVNLLSACLNDPSNNSTGSGIYFADGSISNYIISGIKNTSFIIQDIEIGQRKTKNESDHICNTSSKSLDDPTHIDHIQIATEDLSNYTLENIDINRGFVTDCSKINRFCCYSITTNHLQRIESKYSYKLVSFTGVRTFHRRTIGIRVCAVVACESDTSCSIRGSSAPTLTFNNISVTMQFENVSNNDFRPVTLNYNLLPATNYCFNKRISSGDNIEYHINSTTPQNSLLAYGIFGRIYDNDNKIGGASQRMILKVGNYIAGNNNIHNPSIVIISVASINLLLHYY